MTRIGPYRILGTIALGGMGEVFLAALQREGGFEKRVALKRALPELMNDPSFVELFEREARLAAALDHRNIVQVFDFGRHEAGAWIAMEYVHGVDLKAVLDQETTLPPTLAVEIVCGCARGLEYAHRATDARGRALHVVHRDVSPQNVLLSFQGDVKLADFGLAHAAARESGGDGGLRGKYAYMSPEQARGDGVGAASDQFSLGVVLYEALCGTRAFFADDGTEAILQRVRAAAPLTPFHELNLPEPLQAVMRRAMAREGADRYPDVGAFADALREAARRSALVPATETLGEWLSARFPDRAQGDLGAAALLTPLETTAAADVPITTRPPPAAPEVTETAEAPISAVVADPRPDRRALVAALLLLFVVGGWAALRQLASDEVAPPPAVTPTASAPNVVDQGLGDVALAPDAAVDASPEPDAAATDMSPDAAPVVVRRPTPPPRKSRPRLVAARPVPDAAAPPSPRVATPAPVPSVAPVAASAPAPSPGPRLKLRAAGARVQGGRPRDGWRGVPPTGLLLRITGGDGPPVSMRVRARPTHLEAALDARPWGQVFLDGRDLGTTPVATVPLRAGQRRLAVRGPDGRTTNLRLEVEP